MICADRCWGEVRTRFELAWPFSVIGTIAALPLFLAGGAVHLGLACALPLCLWLIGRRATRVGHRGWFSISALLCWAYATVLYAVANSDALYDAPGIGALIGLGPLCLIVIPLGSFVIAARDSGQARAGSLALRAEHRFVWGAGLMTLDPVIVVAAIYAACADVPVVSLALVSVMLALKLAFVVLDLRLVGQLERLGHEAEGLRELAYQVPATVEALDLGIGEARRGVVAPTAAYRELPAFSRAVVGDAAASIELVRAQLRNYGQLHVALYGLPALALGGMLVCCLGAFLTR